jgi:hypothetical protein
MAFIAAVQTGSHYLQTAIPAVVIMIQVIAFVYQKYKHCNRKEVGEDSEICKKKIMIGLIH